MTMKHIMIGIVLCMSNASYVSAAMPGEADGYPRVMAPMANAQGTVVGQVNLKQGKAGLVAHIDVQGLTPGWHAIHIHETGNCNADGFASAGGHASGEEANHTHQHFGKNHGFLESEAYHIGDMPNIWVHHGGAARADYFLPEATLEAIMDEDGAAVIIHEKADDYASQPSGAAGARVACGVLK